LIGGAAFIIGICAFTALIAGVGALTLIGGDTALAGVHVGGVPIGGMTVEESAAALADWQITLTDGETAFSVPAADLGVGIDADASARMGVEYGRRVGGIGAGLRAAFGRVDLPPVIAASPAGVAAALDGFAPSLNRTPINAGVQFQNGQIVPRDPIAGRALDALATADALSDPRALSDGTLNLVMRAIPPAISDPAPLVAAAQALIANPLTLRLYDPVLDRSETNTIPPETWSAWLTAADDPASPLGVRLQLDPDAARAYLAGQPVGAGKFGAGRRIDADEAAAALDQALADGTNAATTRLYYDAFPHTVSAGDSLTGVAWAYGIPYPYIEAANPGVGALSVGQTITIPSLDEQIPLPVVPEKRIVVSISGQRVRVYERGALLHDWIASTGIASSPTWQGVYQVLMREPNAYAGNWDLWMPSFIGVYHPIPGAAFINGFHGFPTRGGGQLLWTGDLGRRVTYGCILLSNENVTWLYDWAETGVVVEIQA
jgi:LysM repeat protein